MVWSWLKKLFVKEDDSTYEEVQMPVYEPVKHEHHAKKVEQTPEPKYKEPSVKQDNSFKRYICGKCFRWSDFKGDTYPSSCPHCGNTNKTSFKPQRSQVSSHPSKK